MRLKVLLVVLIFTIIACNKVKIDQPVLDVSINRATFKVGDSILFNLSGKSDYIVFYSGEVGSTYANRNRTTNVNASNAVQFSTANSNGNQANNVKLFASSNFNGKIDTVDIKAATWTDITSRAKLATNATVVSSGAVDLSDFQKQTNLLYLAFRYTSALGTSTSTGKSWVISAFSAINRFPDGSLGTIASDISSAGFTPISFVNDSLVWTVTATTMTFPAGKPGFQDNDWVISKPFRLDLVTPDGGQPIKNTSSTLTNFLYVYSTPGTYNVTFVANNANIDDKKEVVKQLSVTITP